MKNVNNNMTQLLIRTIVKKALNDIKEFPERNSRNLVDMALNFSNGRFQKSFFETAQKMLHNEHSIYYKLIQDIAFNVDTDRILTFGINVGYTSCTVGAETIRKIEHEQMFNIPWSLTLITDLQNNPNAIHAYQSIIRQGKALGIFTWLIFSSNQAQQLLPLVKNNPDCSFVLFSHAEEFTEDFIAEADSLHNLMLSIQYEENIENICAMLRSKKMLYSVHFPYQAKDTELITGGDFFYCTETLHPVFTFLIPDSSCPEHTQHLIYDYIQDARNSQDYQTIPLDLVYDNLHIDSIISNDSCSASFDKNGYLVSAFNKDKSHQYNIFENKLSDIFKHSFPKITE